MKKIATLTAVLLLLSVTAPLFAQKKNTAPINDFSNPAFSVELTGSSTFVPPAKVSHHPHHSHSFYFYDWWDDLSVFLWALNNLSVNYEKYPYEYDNKYLVFDNINDPDYPDDDYYDDDYDDYDDILITSDSERSWRYSLSESVFYDFNRNYGMYTCFEGVVWKFFGPMVENTVFTDLAEYNGYAKVGGQLALVQSNVFSWWIYGGASMGYGDAQTVSKYTGGYSGFYLRSYPGDPLVLEIKGDVLFTPDSNKVHFDSYFSVGIMFDELEMFARLRYFETSDNDSGEVLNETYAAEAGLRYYF